MVVTAPKVSILIPCHSLSYLDSAVESIAAQSLSKDQFDVILIGDRININYARDILKRRLSNYRVYESKFPGIVNALNLGLTKTNSALIARMDEDDYMEPDRLLLQVKYLAHNPDCVAVGGQLKLINEIGNIIGVSRYKEKLVLRSDLLRRSPMAHPAVTFRRESVIAVGGYRENLPEDWDLWMRLSQKGQLANLKDYVLRYRVHAHQLSRNNMYEQSTSRLMIGTSDYARTFGLSDIPQKTSDSEIWCDQKSKELRGISKDFVRFEKSVEREVAIFSTLKQKSNLLRLFALAALFIRNPFVFFYSLEPTIKNKCYYLKYR